MLLLFPTPSFPANFTPSKPLCLPHRRLLLLLRCKAADFDSFTERSGYLFDLTASETDSLTEYSVSKIAAVYRRKPLILLRRLYQIGTTFGNWFALRYLDRVYDRSDLMFQVFFFAHFVSILWFSASFHVCFTLFLMVLKQIRAAELRKILVELGPVRLVSQYWRFLLLLFIFKLKFHVEQSLIFYFFVQYYKFLFSFLVWPTIWYSWNIEFV